MELRVQYDGRRGLLVNWTLANGMALNDIPLRVVLSGDNTFYVWGGVDSGEGAPVWAEPGLKLVLFGGSRECRGAACRVEEAGKGRGWREYRAVASHSRVEVTLSVTA